MRKQTRHYIRTQLFDVEEAAAFTGLSIPALQQRALRGTLDHEKKGKGRGILLFHRADLERIRRNAAK